MKRYLIGLLSMLSVHAAMGQQAIDVHCHNILPTFKELLDRHGQLWKRLSRFRIGMWLLI